MRPWLASLCFLLSTGSAQAGQSGPIAPLEQVFIWLAGGISSARIERLAATHVTQTGGLTPACVRALQNAGADAQLIGLIEAPATARPTTGSSSAHQKTASSSITQETQPADCTDSSAAAELAALTHKKDWQSAEEKVRSLLQDDSQNASLLFVLGTVLRSEERFDDAMDAFDESSILSRAFQKHTINFRIFSFAAGIPTMRWGKRGRH